MNDEPTEAKTDEAPPEAPSEPTKETEEQAEARVAVALHLCSGKTLHYEAGVGELEQSLAQWNDGKYMGSGSDPGLPLRMLLVNQGACEALDARVLNENSVGMVALAPDLVEVLTPMILAMAAESPVVVMQPLGDLAALLRAAAPQAAAVADEIIARERLQAASSSAQANDGTANPAPEPTAQLKDTQCPSCGHNEVKPAPDVDGLFVCTSCRMQGSADSFCAG